MVLGPVRWLTGTMEERAAVNGTQSCCWSRLKKWWGNILASSLFSSTNFVSATHQPNPESKANQITMLYTLNLHNVVNYILIKLKKKHVQKARRPTKCNFLQQRTGQENVGIDLRAKWLTSRVSYHCVLYLLYSMAREDAHIQWAQSLFKPYLKTK